ncbi:AMP-dependent synthetase/ligase [Bacteroidota bacterium]
MHFATIPAMYNELANKYGDSKAAIMYKFEGEYKSISHEKTREMVECFALGLMELGIRERDRVGIVSENRVKWIIADLGILSIGAVDAPIFPTLTAKQEQYIFGNCTATAVIVSNNFQLQKILEFKKEMPSLRHVIVMNNDYKTQDVSVKSMAEVMKRGKELRTSEERKLLLRERMNRITTDDLATIIYTSGTTGDPKGVMLTHKNILSNIEGVFDAIPLDDNDTFLSFLPMCHSYERTTGYYSALATGGTVALAESLETVAVNLQEVKPTIMTTVPRLLEIVKKKIYTNMETESPAKRKIFDMAIDVGRKYIRKKLNNERISIGLKTKYALADKMVFSKIRERFGGNLRMFVSGGAALSDDVCEFFLAAGMTVIEGYGLTEASPIVSANRLDSIEIGSIGKPFFNLEVKFLPDGELLTRGPNVMKGYWADKVATDEVIDEDGWLYTGDIGKFTDQGNIKITDRKKHILVSSSGKNIAPQPIETLLSESPFIEQCLLIGDRREYCTALITPDFDQLRKLAGNFGIKFEIDTELISNEKIVKTVKQDIDRLQKDLAKYERVRKFSLLSQPFSVENGELTPKMSVKRHVVERKFSHLIDSLYGFEKNS